MIPHRVMIPIVTVKRFAYDAASANYGARTAGAAFLTHTAHMSDVCRLIGYRTLLDISINQA